LKSRPFFYIPLLLLALVTSACHKNKDHVVAAHYFNIKKFFLDEALNLSHGNTSVRKTTGKDMESAVNQTCPTNWEKELEIFSECDINKPAWVNSYKVDSIVMANYTVVNYHTSESLPVKKIQVLKSIDGIRSIYIERSSGNPVYHSFQKLLYTKDKGYNISGEQKVLFFKASSYHILAEYI
jgi:hypothetical protein